jgi:hypothetical protein
MHRLKEWRDLRPKGACVIAIPAAATVAIACLSYALGGRGATPEESVNQTRQAFQEIQKMETLEGEATRKPGLWITGQFLDRESIPA